MATTDYARFLGPTMVAAIRQVAAALMALVAVLSALVERSEPAVARHPVESTSPSESDDEGSRLPTFLDEKCNHDDLPPQAQGLPDGVPTSELWGRTLLEFGKFKGSSYQDTAKKHPEYIAWIKAHCAQSTVAVTRDFHAWIIHEEKRMKKSEMMFPGSFQHRRFK